MPGMIPGGVVGQMEEFHDFLVLLRDPAKLEQAIQSIKDATALHDKAEASAAQALAEANQRIANAAAADAANDKRARDLEGKAAQLTTREQALAAGNAQLQADRAAHADSQTSFGNQVSAITAELAQRSAALDEREADLKVGTQALEARVRGVVERQQKLEAAEAEHAKRVAALKQIVG